MSSILKFIILMMISLTGFMVNPLPAVAEEVTVVEADQQNQTAQDWLDLIDQTKYKESWDVASADVRGNITSDQWENSITSTLAGLGRRLTRGLDARKEASSKPGLPDGTYVDLIFSSSFANKQQAVETLTLVQDSDGIWRVAAYSIK